MTVLRIQRLCEIFAGIRRDSIGTAPPAVRLTSWPGSAESESEFGIAVTAIYKDLVEGWGEEAKIVIGLAGQLGQNGSDWKVFVKSVQDLRHAKEHRSGHGSSLQRNRDRQLREMCGGDLPSTADEWTLCHSELLRCGESALRTLVGCAKAISNDDGSLDKWRAHATASQDLPALIDEFLELLNRQPRLHAVEYLQRQVQNEWKRRVSLSAGASRPAAEAMIAVERVVLGWALPPLPCDPFDLVDHLGITEAGDVLASLALAHGLCEIVAWDDEEAFLNQVARVWKVVAELI